MIVMMINDMDYGSNPNTQELIEVQAADWQVASKETFTADVIVAQSLNDKENLKSLILPNSLDPNEKWYGRVRHLLTTGWTEWSNIRVFTPVTVDELISNDDIPSRVSNPIIKTNSDPNNHDSTLFTITAEGFSVVGNASHVATTYFIENVNSEVIWSNEYDIINKTSFTVKDIVLESDSIYRIKCLFHSSSGDSSLIASRTIFVTGGKEITLSKYMDVINYAEDFQIEVNKIDGVNSMVYEIIAVNDNNSTVIWSKTVNGAECNKATIPANTLKKDQYYYLRVKRNVAGSSFKYVPFRADTYTNTDILWKDKDRVVLYAELDHHILAVGEVLNFKIDYYKTINFLFNTQLDKTNLEVEYTDTAGNKSTSSDILDVNIYDKTITGKKAGSVTVVIAEKTPEVDPDAQPGTRDPNTEYPERPADKPPLRTHPFFITVES